MPQRKMRRRSPRRSLVGLIGGVSRSVAARRSPIPRPAPDPFGPLPGPVPAAEAPAAEAPIDPAAAIAPLPPAPRPGCTAPGRPVRSAARSGTGPVRATVPARAAGPRPHRRRTRLPRGLRPFPRAPRRAEPDARTPASRCSCRRRSTRSTGRWSAWPSRSSSTSSGRSPTGRWPSRRSTSRRSRRCPAQVLLDDRHPGALAPATDFWPAGTVVNIDAGGTKSSFRTGEQLVATVDDKTHQMTVTRNGKVEKTFPVSMGKPDGKHETKNGTYYVLEKFAGHRDGLRRPTGFRSTRRRATSSRSRTRSASTTAAPSCTARRGRWATRASATSATAASTSARPTRSGSTTTSAAATRSSSRTPSAPTPRTTARRTGRSSHTVAALT